LYLSNELQFKSRNYLHFSDSNSIDAFIIFIELINSQGENYIVGVVKRPPDPQAAQSYPVLLITLYLYINSILKIIRKSCVINLLRYIFI
jgi:hypothetical protein